MQSVLRPTILFFFFFIRWSWRVTETSTRRKCHTRALFKYSFDYVICISTCRYIVQQQQQTKQDRNNVRNNPHATHYVCVCARSWIRLRFMKPFGTWIKKTPTDHNVSTRNTKHRILHFILHTHLLRRSTCLDEYQ